MVERLRMGVKYYDKRDGSQWTYNGLFRTREHPSLLNHEFYCSEYGFKHYRSESLVRRIYEVTNGVLIIKKMTTEEGYKLLKDLKNSVNNYVRDHSSDDTYTYAQRLGRLSVDNDEVIELLIDIYDLSYALVNDDLENYKGRRL